MCSILKIYVLYESREINRTWFNDIINLITESKSEINKLLKNHSDKEQGENITMKSDKTI